MNKRKIFLTTLLIIFLIGVVLSILGVSLGGRLFSFRMQESNQTTDGHHYESGMTVIDDTTASSIENLNLHFRMNDAKIIAGDHFEISGNASYSSYVDDGTWHVTTQEQIAEIQFLTHRIRIPVFWRSFWHWDHGADAKYDRECTITLPTDVKLKNASFRVSAGDLFVETPVRAESVSLNTGAGRCEFSEIMTDSLQIKTGAGESIIRSATVNNSCRASVGAGSIILGSEDHGRSEIHGLNADCGAGELEIYGKLLDTCSVDCSMGSADLTLEGTRSNYTFITKADLGDIDIDDEYDHDGDDFSHQEEHHGDTFGALTLQCSLGDIDVEFYPSR